MTAFGVLFAQVAVALHSHGDFTPNRAAEVESDGANPWRTRIVVAFAIALWLLVWLGGWWLGRFLSAGSFVPTLVGAFFGWCVGLGVATLVFFLDECL